MLRKLPNSFGENDVFDLLTVTEIASALKVPVPWVYERTRRRGPEQMPHLKVGKYLRFRLHEVAHWLERFERK
jgi:excisionase family DNA binding protein